jgi:hypothetical protein
MIYKDSLFMLDVHCAGEIQFLCEFIYRSDLFRFFPQTLNLSNKCIQNQCDAILYRSQLRDLYRLM